MWPEQEDDLSGTSLGLRWRLTIDSCKVYRAVPHLNSGGQRGHYVTFHDHFVDSTNQQAPEKPQKRDSMLLAQKHCKYWNRNILIIALIQPFYRIKFGGAVDVVSRLQAKSKWWHLGYKARKNQRCRVFRILVVVIRSMG